MHYHPRTIPSSEQRDCGSPPVPGTHIIASAQWDIPSQASWEEGRQEEVKTDTQRYEAEFCHQQHPASGASCSIFGATGLGSCSVPVS